MISKVPRIISRARILISHSREWDIQTRCRLQLSQISLMIWFQLLSPALRIKLQVLPADKTYLSSRSWHWPIILIGAISTRIELFLVYNSSPISVNNGTCVDKASVISTVLVHLSSLNNISVNWKEFGLTDKGCVLDRITFRCRW